MNNRAVELMVGLFVVAGLASLVFLATKVGNSNSGTVAPYYVSAKFDNIGGLNAKAPVSIGGVTVGRVSSIALDHDEHVAVVKIAINGDVKNLPLDTSASILTSGMLGAQYIGLEPGGEDEFLVEGDEIEITSSTIPLEKLISQFMFSSSKEDK